MKNKVIPAINSTAHANNHTKTILEFKMQRLYWNRWNETDNDKSWADEETSMRSRVRNEQSNTESQFNFNSEIIVTTTN